MHTFHQSYQEDMEGHNQNISSLEPVCPLDQVLHSRKDIFNLSFLLLSHKWKKTFETNDNNLLCVTVGF